MSTIAPKPYQDEAVKNALEIFRYAENQLQQVDDSDSQRAISAYNGCVLLEAPTGAGKTLMAGLIAESFARTDHRDNAKIVWFWFTPFAGLVEQAKSALKRDFNGLKIRDLSSDRKAYSAERGDVFVTTWARNAETRKLRSSGDLSLALDEFIPELRDAGFRIGVVVDEAHHSFTKATDRLQMLRNPCIRRLNQAVAAGQQGHFGHRLYFELVLDRGAVIAHRLVTQAQLFGDFTRRQAVRKQTENVEFARRQLLDHVGFVLRV